MSLQLPLPTTPPPQGAAHGQVKAWRQWQQGQVAEQRGQWLQAAQAYSLASTLHAEPAYALAAVHAHIKAGQAQQAAAQAQVLVQRQPLCGHAHVLLSHARLELGQTQEAAQGLQAMPSAVPRDLPYWLALGLAQQRSSQHHEAIASLMQALAHKMDDAYLHFHLGTSFKELGMKAEAAECVRSSVLFGVGTSELAARGQLCFLEREACRWPQAAAEMAELKARTALLLPGQPMEHSPFTMAVLEDDPSLLRQCAQHHSLHIGSRVRALPRRAAKAHKGRLRLGYLSADFHVHATAQLMVQMLEAHDRELFEVHLFSTGPDDASPTRRRVQAAADHFTQLRGQPASVVAQRIREAGIEVLVDLKGITYDNQLPVMAHRPAPVQLTWLGFPGTVGAPYIDYVVGDPIVTPMADAADFTECIAQLPQCYQPNDRHRARPPADARAQWGVREDAVLLCGFHQPYKISPEVFDTWCGLLRQLPQAQLWLLHWNTNVEAALRAAAQERGVADHQLCFTPVVPLAQHLGRLACADVFLDTWPCNAHTTASEALWMGVPVVTLKGRTFAGRVGASLLNRVGLNELVCQDVPRYAATVAALAADAPRRQRLRQHLAGQRGEGGLFDGVHFAREFEALLLRMWQRACAGLPPAPLPAQALERAFERALEPAA
jgi:predicted O-linked N-acetylglucosamine transferase (SPINDLY family)